MITKMRSLVLICVVQFIEAYYFRQAYPHHDTFQKEWYNFKARYEKHYKNYSEERRHMEIFKFNYRNVLKHQQLYHRGDVSYEMAINQYGDMSHEDFYRTINSYNGSDNTDYTEDYDDEHDFNRRYTVYSPSYIDWRKKGAVTHVKDQQQCGSCWAFSAIGALEGQYYIKTGRLVSFSEQNLIDCTSSNGNKGCYGGLPSLAFMYLKHKSVSSERSYPYKAVTGRCRYAKKHKYWSTSIKAYKHIPNSEIKLKEAVASIGPISVIIDARNLQFYAKGVYYDRHCSSKKKDLSHAMVLIGYGSNRRGGDYWLLKNSWGAQWGENGFMKLARNRKNHCGVATTATVPIL